MSQSFLDFSTEKAWDYENGFFLTSHFSRFAKHLAHFELYKMITGLPGHIVECGVFKGSSFIRFGTFRHILESSSSRKLIGFDAFGKFPRQSDAQDNKFISHFETEGGDGISSQELTRVMNHKEFPNFELLQGDILETVPEYLRQHPELKIALLHVDVDVYAPTKVILDNFFPRLVKGGLIILDDYTAVAGATRATDEFLVGKNLKVEKLSISHLPSFIRA